MDPCIALLGNRHASLNLRNNLGIYPTELPGAAKVVTLGNASGTTVPTTRGRFGEKERHYLRGCSAELRSGLQFTERDCQRLVSRIVRSARGAARRVRSWTVKALRRHTDGGALYSCLRSVQGVLIGAFKLGSNSLLVDPEMLSVSASFIVRAIGL